MVIAVALLLAMPAQGQVVKKRAKASTMTQKFGPVKPETLKKDRVAIMKAKAQNQQGQAFRGNLDAWKIVTVAEQAQEQRDAFEKLMDRNMENLSQMVPIRGQYSKRLPTNAAMPLRVTVREVANAPAPTDPTKAAVTLTAGDVWGDGSGYQLLIDADATAYGTVIPESGPLTTSGDASAATYAEFEYKIPENADGSLTTENMVNSASVTIEIPAGTCDWVVTNPTAGDRMWIAGNGRYDDYEFEAGKSYEFVVELKGSGDNVTVIIDGEAPPAPEPVALPDGVEPVAYVMNYLDADNQNAAKDVKVAVDGNDVYFQGMSRYLPDAWVKGTLSGTTVTFPTMQFMGEYSSYESYFFYTGSVTTFAYDAEAGTYTAEGEVFGVIGGQYYDGDYFDPVLTKDTGEEPQATTGANVDALPYSNPLATETDFADFGILDSNKDGSTWQFSSDYGAYYSYNSSNNANDWLISPAIKLEAGKKYHFAIDAACALASYPEKFEVKIGAEPKASALTQTVLEEVTVTSTAHVTYENEQVSVTETGYYHFGIHATSDADEYRLMVKNFLVEAGAETAAPAAVSDFALTQTEGKLEVNVAFTAPTKTVGGADLESITKIDILRNGQVIKSLTGGGSSSDGQISWVAADQGYENAQDIASINFGSGFTATFTDGGNTNTPKYYTSGSALRMYGNNTMTISGAGITKITFTLTGNENQTQLEANVGNYALEGTTGTWTGEADAVTFTVPNQKQARIQKIEIEGTVVEGLTPGAAITYVDNDESLAVGTYTYQVIPYNEAGVGAKSEEKTIFLSVALDVPYTFDFTENLLELFGVIDNNNDGKTWTWSASNGAYYGYSSANAADDYLITMPFNLKAGKTYNVIVNARSSGYDEKFEVKAGKEATVAGLTETVIAETTIPAEPNGEWDDYEGTFAPAEDGTYNFAIHATSDADMFNLCVKTLTVELAPEPTAPAAIADFTAEPGAEGALEANLAFTTPTKAIDGSALTGTVDVKVYRDNELVNTLTGLATGSAQTWKDTEVEGGSHTYFVIAANESGDGLKSDKVKVFIGPDEIGEVDGIEITGSTASTISLKWNAPAGVNGGYVNTDNLQYAVVGCHVEVNWIFQYLVVDGVLGTVTGQTSGTFNYPVDEGDQDWKYFGVVALGEGATAPAEGDEYAGGYTAAIVGAPYEMPFIESFAGMNLAYSMWTYSGPEDAYVVLTDDASDDDGGAVLMTTYDAAGTVQFESGRIKVEGANPTLLFDAKATGITSGKVLASADDAEWTVVQNFNVTDDYQTVKVSLLNAKGQRFTRIAFAADITTPSEYQGQDAAGNYVFDWNDVLYIDNIKVVDLYEYNLTAAVKAKATVTAGQSVPVTATITNEGEFAASGYTVKITAGEKEIFNETFNDELAPFTKKEVEADFATTVFDEAGDVTIKVEVEFENELNPDDNVAETLITIKDPTVPAPAGLTATDNGVDGVDLSWSMPAEARAAAAETEDFDDQASFPEFDLGGITADEHNGALADWTLYDGNGITTYGFNGITFPNSYQPMAFIPFNPSSSQLSADLSANYAPHSGSQFMMSFCPVDENGNAPATDHWMISPSLSGDAQTISFYARAITDQYGAETFEILASSTDNQPSSFTVVSSESTAATDWVEFTADLPAGTKYFAIRHTSTDVFGLMIDDVTFAAGEGAPLVPVNYNVYYEQGKLATVNADVTTYTAKADQIGVGEHVFSVTAVYAGGVESKPISATVDVITNINQIAVNGKPVDVYTLDGKLVRRQTTSLDGLKGFYIINGKKVMIK